MKILIISHNNNENSGANRSLMNVIEHLSKSWDITVLCNNTKGNLPTKLSGFNVKVIKSNYEWWYAPRRSNKIVEILKYIQCFIKYYCFSMNINALIKVCRNENFDLIYTNTSVIDIGAKLAYKLKLPHVWHVREFGKEDFNFLSIVSERKRKKYFKKTNKIIAISNILKKKYESYVDKSKIAVIYNGLFKSNLYKKEYNFYLCDKEINILIAGQISPAKGQDEAIDALDILIKKGINVNLYIAGSGDNIFLKKAISKYDIDNHIRILGQVSDLYELRKNMHIELVCSRCEAFGRVTLEAMMHSLPVVGAATGGTTELINDGVNGVLYNKGNSHELAEKIYMLIEDKELRSRIIDNAYNFSKNFMIEETVLQVEKSLLCEIRNWGGE